MATGGSSRPRAAAPLIAATLIAAIATTAILVVRNTGLLETLELGAYDWFIRLSAQSNRIRAPILLVMANERDIHDLGQWPFSDAVLAELIERVDQAGARAIGLDIYRDIQQPPGTTRLNQAFSRLSRLVGITKVDEAGADGVRPPPALVGTGRIGAADIVVDHGGTVRRGLLYLDSEQGMLPSFALRVALIYLADQGIGIAPDPHHPQGLHLGATALPLVESSYGPYSDVDARGYQFLLDFRAGTGAFDAVSWTDVLGGKVPSGNIDGRVVLVGTEAASVRDYFFTPLDRGFGAMHHQPGLAIHAHAVDQLLRMALQGEAPRRVLSKPLESLLIALCALGAFVALYVRVPWLLAAVTVAGLVLVSMTTYFSFAHGLWLPLVPPALCWILAIGSTTAYLSHWESRERAALMRLFSRHVSASVAEAIWASRSYFLIDGRPSSQRVMVTALFTDLTGYTSVAESLPPERLLDWLNRYMDMMAHEVGLHDGIVRQYAGDAVVAIFGVPIPRTTEMQVAQDAIQAVECAIVIGERVSRLNLEFRSQGLPSATVRIGIFTGPAVAGLVGSEDRAEYAIVGDTLNTASRLESFDKSLFAPDADGSSCRVFIGDSTLARLGDRFQTEFVTEALLKGKRASVSIYRVLGRQPAGVERPKEGNDAIWNANVSSVAFLRERLSFRRGRSTARRSARRSI